MFQKALNLKSRLTLFVYLALTVTTLGALGQVRNFEFTNYDDKDYVYENLHVLNGLTQDGIIWAFTTGHAANWHPITWLSLMLDCQLFGTNPGWMHLINLLLHLVNTLLLFTVLKKMTGSLWPSAFVAAAFALHPMHVESVAWIAERKDVLSTLFWLLTMLAYLTYVRRPGAFRYALTLVLFVLGLMAKPMLVTLPFVLLLLDYWPLDRFAAPRTIKTSGGKSHKTAAIAERRRVLYRIIIEKIPFFTLAAVSSVITFIVQKGSGAMPDINTLSLQSRVANVFLSYTRYIGKMFWPQNLAVFYPLDIVSIRIWQIVLCVLLLLVISIFAVRFGREQRYLPVGWFWFVGTLIPVIGLVQSGAQSHADRYTYIPYIGLFIMIAWGLPELLSKWPQRKIVLGLSMVIALTTLGICTHQQVSYWNNSASLFTHALKVTQNNYIAYYSRGVAYGDVGRWQDAIEAYKQAIRIRPDFADAYSNRGAAYVKLGRSQEAIEDFSQAIRIKPNHADAHNNLAWIFATSPDPNVRNPSDAIRLAQEACNATNFKDPALLDTLAAAYASKGRFADAVETARAAINLAGNAKQSQLKNTIQEHLGFYTQGKPYIEPAPK